jgi:hypothetical protein
MKNRVLFLVFLLYAVSGVFSSHFRGGIIMVRPQPGGAPKEVGALLLLSSPIIIVLIIIFGNEIFRWHPQHAP